MQPKLSVAYNSHQGTGILGPKWSVTGLSAIVRCGQTLSQDTFPRPVNLVSGDTFCLDGERLVRTTGSVEQFGSFAPSSIRFRKITVIQTNPSNGIEGFQVRDPDGRIFYYGTRPATRLNANSSGRISITRTTSTRSSTGTITRFSLLTAGTSSSLPAPNGLRSSFRTESLGEPPRIRSVSGQSGSSTSPDSYAATLPTSHYVGGYQLFAGHRLAELQISGPNETGSGVLLKKYKFDYLTPTITQETLLSTIHECDANDVCKRPTTISWEPGSFTFLRKDTGIADAQVANREFGYSASNPATGWVADLSSVYRRIIPVDIDNDGRDDIVYRAHSQGGSLPSEPSRCLTWFYRKNTSSGLTVSFGPRNELPEGWRSDPECSGDATKFPYPGEPILADFNLDDYNDIFAANGDGGDRIYPNGTRGAPRPDAMRPRGYTYFEAAVPGSRRSCFLQRPR